MNATSPVYNAGQKGQTNFSYFVDATKQGTTYCLEKTKQGTRNVADTAAFCVDETERLEKVIKVSNRLIGLGGIACGGLSFAFEKISSQFKSTYEFFESIRFFGVLTLLTVPNAKDGKYFIHAGHSWQAVADKIFLAMHSGLKLINAGNRFGLIKLGKIASVSIGHLPVFKLVFESFMIISSFFGSWDSINKLIANKKKLAEVNEKIKKWEARPAMILAVRTGNKEELARLKNSYQSKIECLNKEARLNADLLSKVDSTDPEYAKLSPEKRNQIKANCTIQAKVIDAKIRVKMPVWQSRLEKINTGNHQSLADEFALTKTDKAGNKIGAKRCIQITEAIKKSSKESILHLISAVAKIIVISLALIFTVSTATFTSMHLLPIFIFGFINDSCSLWRHILKRPEPIKIVHA